MNPSNAVVQQLTLSNCTKLLEASTFPSGAKRVNIEFHPEDSSARVSIEGTTTTFTKILSFLNLR